MNASNLKHTPTPWVACENDPDGFDGDKIWITTDDRLYNSIVPIAEVGIDYSEPMNTEQLANADFIALAVNCHADMLALLKEAADFVQPFNRGADLLVRIDAAISKATA